MSPQRVQVFRSKLDLLEFQTVGCSIREVSAEVTIKKVDKKNSLQLRFCNVCSKSAHFLIKLTKQSNSERFIIFAKIHFANYHWKQENFSLKHLVLSRCHYDTLKLTFKICQISQFNQKSHTFHQVQVIEKLTKTKHG